MSYIPDTRDPLERGPFSENKEPNAYYEGLLDKESLWEMANYDFGVADVINALDNIESSYEMAESYMDDDIPEDKDTLFSYEEMEFLCDEKTVKFIKNVLLIWVEHQRDEMVIAKIENMPDEAYIPRFKQLEEDYNNLSEEEFLAKYKRREYNEYGDYDGTQCHGAVIVTPENAAKERFRMEYAKLECRCEKLQKMLDNWDNLDFTPRCTKELLQSQLNAMAKYLDILKFRADIEKIDLSCMEGYKW